jgi:hypothetical protein
VSRTRGIEQEDVDKSLEEIGKQHCIWEPVTRQKYWIWRREIESNIGNQPYQPKDEFQVEKDSDF